MENLHIYLFRWIDDFELVWTLVEFVFLLAILGIIVLNRVLEKWRNHKVVQLVVGSIVMARTAYEYLGDSLGTYLTMTIVLVIILLITIRELGLIAFDSMDYILLYLILFWYKRLDLFIPARESFTVIVLFTSIFGFATIKKTKKSIFNIWVTVSVCFATCMLFEWIYEDVLYQIYCFLRIQFEIGTIVKAVYFMIMMVGSLVISTYLMKKLKNKLMPICNKLQEVGERYRKSERYFLWFSIATTIFIYGIQLLEYYMRTAYERYIIFWQNNGDSMPYLAWLLIILLLCAQAYVLFMLVQLVETRKNLEDEQFAKQSLVLYQSDLDKNMGQIRKINHDIKNVFFTMTNFVERSSDEEMKQYFYEKIMPFASEEIKKSNLYQTLQQVEDEQLRAFLYYKIQQGLSYEVDIELQIEIKGQAEYSIPVIDLVRILGILIDNAIEECVQISEGKVYIKLTQDAQMKSYRISNHIREQGEKQGVLIGTTTKGLGRGNGLVIVQDLMAKYENVVLNTYTKEHIFNQNLVIYSK